jgi:hypothetical protein
VAFCFTASEVFLQHHLDAGLLGGEQPGGDALLAAYQGGVLLAGAANGPAQLRIVLDAVAGLALGSVPAC